MPAAIPTFIQRYNQHQLAEVALENPEIFSDQAEEPIWQVIVYDDPINLMSYVTMVFEKIFGFSRETAEKKMLEVHEQGRSILWTGAREEGELYVEKLQGYLLMAALEQIA